MPSPKAVGDRANRLSDRGDSEVDALLALGLISRFKRLPKLEQTFDSRQDGAGESPKLWQKYSMPGALIGIAIAATSL
jgi:hypothetical protein